MKYLFESSKKKTWDGYRWMFVLLAALFGFITARLLSTVDFLLLLIPASFCIGCTSVAIFTEDRLLQKVINLFIAIG